MPATPEVAGALTVDEQRRVEIFRRASVSVVYIANIAVRQNLFSFDVLQIQQGTAALRRGKRFLTGRSRENLLSPVRTRPAHHFFDRQIESLRSR